MGSRINILLVILVTYNATSILCCSHEPCSELGVKNQHDQQHQTQNQEGHKSQWSHQTQHEDSPTPVSATGITTTRPIKSVVELVHGGSEPVVQSIESKEINGNNENARGDERLKRHVHLDLGGYGYEHSVPLFGFQDYHYDHGYGHYDHYGLDHHHHHSHHHGHH